MENQSADFVALRTRANQHLLDVIRQFLPAAQWAKAVICNPLPLRAACGEAWVNEDQTIVSLAIALLVEPEQNIVIRERAAGFGDDVDSAMHFAAFTWATSVFVAAAGLYDPQGHPGHMALTVERPFQGANGQNRIWKIVSSPATEFSWGAGSEKSPGKPPDTLTTLDPLLKHLTLESKMHWIKVFLSRTGKEIDVDCTLNNEKSPEANRLFANFAWPRKADNLSIRQFHILKPTEEFAPQISTPKRFGFLSRK